MNDDVHLKGSSVPLASSNIGQSGLRHGLNTNRNTTHQENQSIGHSFRGSGCTPRAGDDGNFAAAPATIWYL